MVTIPLQLTIIKTLFESCDIYYSDKNNIPIGSVCMFY